MLKKVFFLCLILPCLCFARPQGFDGSFERPEPPNSIKGLQENGKDGDYVLLMGRFVKKLSDTDYLFEDHKKDQIKVVFTNLIVPADFELNINYVIWTQILKTGMSAKLNMQLLSPKPPPME